MTDDARVQQLLEELLDSTRTPEDVCRDAPELLAAVRERWQRLRAFDAQLEQLFPTPAEGGGRSAAPKPPRIPGYTVGAVLGRGGVGLVYEALHERLGRRVALKVLLAGEYAVPEELARFRREAEVVASLRHPNVVQVFDLGEHLGRPWFTMELMEGGSLAHKLAGTPQPARAAATLLVTLAEAMQAAHDGGVVHRDLKPSNVLLTADGTPKISDFGLARRLGGGAEITRSGSRLGTPSYMAPEQALGRERQLGPAVDVYALGAVLYELLTGRPPFRGETAAETERQVIAEEPARPSRLNARVPRDLETICLKCLRKETSQRYASAAALAADTQRFLRGEPIAARPASLPERALKWMRRRPGAAAAIATGALLVLVVAGSLLFFGLQRGATERGVRDDLLDVARHEQAGAWGEARTALERAKARLGGSAPQALQTLVEQADRELALVARLDAIRMQRGAIVAGRFDIASNMRQADADYDAALREGGLGGADDDPASVAARVAASPVRAALLAALDNWSNCAPYGAGHERQEWVLSVARQADPDPTGWRDRLRDAASWWDRDALAALAREAHPSDASLPSLVALAERLGSLGGDGVPLLERLQQEFPGDFWTNMILGDALTKTRVSDAIRYYQAAVSIRPDAAVAHNNLGHALALDGRLDYAIEQFRQALRLEPSFSFALANIAYTHEVAGRRAEAIALYREALQQLPDSPDVLASLAATLAQDGQFEEAEQHARRALAVDPACVDAHVSLAFAFHAQGREDEAIDHGRQALALDELRADAHVNLGLALLSKGSVTEAVAEGRRARELGVRNAAGHTGLCVLLAAGGQLDEAIGHGEEAVRLGPARSDTHNDLGGALAAAGRFDEAIAQFEEAVRLGPTRMRPRYNLGNALAMKERFDEATGHYRAALQLEPDYAPAHASLGMALLMQGRPGEGRDSLLRAMELFPEAAPQRMDCASKLRTCERLVELEQKLSGLLASGGQPADAPEALQLATLCRLQKRYALAARFHADAFAIAPPIADDLRQAMRYNAACYASLAAAGAGAESVALSDDERAQWRARAREWLRADLAAWGRLLDAPTPESRALAQQRLASWLTDADLASLREEAELSRLPAPEQEECRALWAEAAAALARANESG